MKKKVKLITTFASLGLALALMVFGVYAATTKSFNIQTQVGFQATAHVQATVTITETDAYAKAATPSYAAAVADGLTDGKMSISRSAEGVDTDGIKDILLGEVTLSDEATCYSYKVTIKNDDKNNNLTITFTAADKTADGYKVTFTGEKTTTLTPGQSAEYTCVIEVTTIDGSTVTIANADLKSTYKLDDVLKA